jgi:hypothetical protein
MLAIATAPWHRAHRAGLPPTPDRGFEGAAILMVTLGALGAMSMVFVLLALLGRPTATWVGAPMAFLVLSAIAAAVRSLLHMAPACVAWPRSTSTARWRRCRRTPAPA